MITLVFSKDLNGYRGIKARSTSRGPEKMSHITIGVDISKDTLDVYRLPEQEHCQFSNDAKGFKSFIKWLDGAPVYRIVYEATGAYHRAFEQAFGQTDLPLSKVNPLHAKRFGQALGKLAKTDKMDAVLLARFGAVVELRTRQVAPQIMYDLKELHIARKALIKDRTAAKNRQKNLTLPMLMRDAKQSLKHIEARLKRIDKAIGDLIKSDTALAERLAILISIPGIGECSAYALIIDMPELGELDGQTAAALSGTAPMVRQSGKWKGKSFVQGGRSQVRQALYMPALVASTYNPNMKILYRRLIEAGKPPKVALTAIMRKLIVLANALVRDQRKWNEKMA